MLQVAEIAGLRALVVDAKDEGGRRFHEQIEFIRSVGDPFRLILPLKDTRKLVS